MLLIMLSGLPKFTQTTKDTKMAQLYKDKSGKDATLSVIKNEKYLPDQKRIYISDNPDAPKAGSEPTKAEQKQSKQAAKTVKKLTVEGKNDRTSEVKAAARQAAAERASAKPSESRSAAEERSIRTQKIYEGGGPGFNTPNKKTQKEDAKVGKEAEKIYKEKLKQRAQGTQANHHVTDSKNHTKTIKGGSLGGGSLSIGEFIEQIK